MLNFLPWLIKHHLCRGSSAHPAKLNFVHKPRVHALQDDILKMMMLDKNCDSYQLPRHVTLNAVKSL
jgi:hypothetical protein